MTATIDHITHSPRSLHPHPSPSPNPQPCPPPSASPSASSTLLGDSSTTRRQPTGNDTADPDSSHSTHHPVSQKGQSETGAPVTAEPVTAEEAVSLAPENAEYMHPGAELAVLLARLAGTGPDLGTLKDDELISVLIGWRRLTSWAQAAETGAVSELEARSQGPHTRDGVLCSNEGHAGVGSEINLALTLTEKLRRRPGKPGPKP